MNDLAAKNSQALWSKPVSFKKMNALVVDNVVNMRMAIVSMLNDLGFGKVYHANNGLEAMELLGSEKIDLVLSEYHLPKMDGLTLLNRLRSEPKTAQLPFIMTSANIEQSEVLRAIKSGVSEYVVKPFSAKILTQRVQRALLTPVKHKGAAGGTDEKPAAPACGKLQLLIVDDVPDNIQLLTELLKKDYALKAAINGETALKICLSDQAPDMVLLDIMMPQMNGLEICQRLKANPKTQHITVIFISALDQTDDIVKGFELGAVDYITKPFSPPVVKARIRTQAGLLAAQTMLRAQVDQFIETARQHEKFEQAVQLDLKLQTEDIFQSLHQLERNVRDSVNVKACAKSIAASTSRLSQVFPAMLALRQIEDGCYRLAPVQFSLTRQMCEVIEIFHTVSGQKNIDIQFNSGQDYRVRGEVFLTLTILSNLYKNALEAAPKGSVIRIGIDSSGSWVKLSMNNQGTVPDAIKAVMFDKQSSDGKKHGHGIGTYAAKLMTEIQQGKITFDSTQEKGTSFYVYLKA